VCRLANGVWTGKYFVFNIKQCFEQSYFTLKGSSADFSKRGARLLSCGGPLKVTVQRRRRKKDWRFGILM
jgi:hypothetical protein